MANKAGDGPARRCETMTLTERSRATKGGLEPAPDNGTLRTTRAGSFSVKDPLAPGVTRIAVLAIRGEPILPTNGCADARFFASGPSRSVHRCNRRCAGPSGC